MKAVSLILLHAVLGVIAAPAAQLDRRSDTTKEYDIIMGPGVDVAATLASLGLDLAMDNILMTYNNSYFHGFSGVLTHEVATTLGLLPSVLAVGEVVEATLSDSRNNAPWGLQRISQQDTIATSKSTTAQTYTYTYPDPALGRGADVYVLDTGIVTSHPEFGGRASMGYSYYPDSNTDDNGHGTHCAGTIAGTTVGVAPGANLIGVKVLRANGSGTSTSLLAGFDHVAHAHSTARQRPSFIGSVASLSLGFAGRSDPVESALAKLLDAGVHAAIAAGNSGTDACSASPAAMGGAKGSAALTVGAVDIRDQVAAFSNSGSCVDVYAPGVEVVSASWMGGYATLSGTSMATPHVAGLVAYFLAGVGKGEAPGVMKERVVRAAVGGKVKTDQAPGYVQGGALVVVDNVSTEKAAPAPAPSPSPSPEPKPKKKGGLLGALL